MPAQEHRLSFPCSVSNEGRTGERFYSHKSAWITACHAKSGRRMYVKVPIPGQGVVVVWLPSRVIKEMIKYLEKDLRLERLREKERVLLYGPSKKERIEKMERKDINTSTDSK